MPLSNDDDHCPVVGRVMVEEHQAHETRVGLYRDLEMTLGMPVVSFFTSFRFPVMIEDSDADMLEGFLQKIDLKNGFALLINSPGGSGLAAERIVNICRGYSGAKGFVAIVPNKAKSAATMVCFGAKKVIMGLSSELGPVDPQVAAVEDGQKKRFSVFNVIKSYDELFSEAKRTKGNLQPLLQQLANYDAREIKEYRAIMELSEDIAIRSLKTGMMRGMAPKEIKKRIAIFLTPKYTKTHGRPIYASEAQKCGINVEIKNATDPFWQKVYEIYIRLSRVSAVRFSKCVETREHSFTVGPPTHDNDES